MASFTIVADKPPPRSPSMLIRNLVDWQGWPEAIIPYDLVAPGLYPDETVFQLDSGEEIAISVSTARMPNGGGMSFRGWARVITGDGSTLLDAAGEEMELEFVHIVTPTAFAALDVAGDPAEGKIAKEIVLLMLGEAPTMVPIENDPDAVPMEVALDDADHAAHPEKAAPGTVLDHNATEAPMIGWSEEIRMNASIRHALELFARAQPEVDVAALLRA